MKYVMTYRAVEDFLPLAQQHYAAHSARVDEFARRGVLLMVGTFTEPVNGEAMGVFTTREAAEEFIAGDPPREQGQPHGDHQDGDERRGHRETMTRRLPDGRREAVPSPVRVTRRPAAHPLCVPEVATAVGRPGQDARP